jgi:hypothetical protein
MGYKSLNWWMMGYWNQGGHGAGKIEALFFGFFGGTRV